MKNYVRKLTAALLAFAMVVSTITPTALAAPANTGDSDDKSVSAGEVTLSETAKNNLAAAKIVASLGLGENNAEDSGKESKEKSAIFDAIFNGYNDVTDLSDFNISSKKMDKLTKEILEENNMTDTVDVTYETDSDGNVTTAEVEMDPMVALAAEELSTVYNLSEEQSQQLLGMYSQYIQLCEANADMFGVQVPYNTTRDTNANPIGSLLDIAGIPAEAAQAGYVDFDTLSGVIQLFYLGTQFAVSEYKDEVIDGRNEALAVVKDGMTTMQKYLAINEWLAANCNFAMDYIMPEMVEPEPAENKLYTYAYQCMYDMIYNQVHDGTYDALKDVYGEEQAEAIATQQAKAYMVDVQEDGGSGEQQAASTAASIVGMWGSNQVGVFVAKKAVCFGYSSVFAYLLQCANPDIYLKSGKTDLDTAENWKSYKELNYELDGDGNPVKDDNGDYKWSTKAAAIVDYVKIKFAADVTMFGQDSTFGEVHYWNAVNVDGEWYYVDSCYIDIYVECMNRDRVETDGNLNNLYFMFSDTSCREMYKDNYEDIFTLYENIATDQTYEDAWFSFAKSHTYTVDGKIYYFYDSTDLIDIMNDYGNGSSGTSRAAEDGVTDYEGLFTDTEYKLVYHNASDPDSKNSFETLVDFNNGQVYNPETEKMEYNGLIDALYEEHQEYVQEYPSISISCAYYDGKLYFSLSNCVLSYDLGTGAVEKLIEYTEVSGERDMTKGLGGMGFTMSDNPGDNGITVQNPPLADMTIKDGKMYVSIATRYAFISGKDFGQLKDYSSYGYKFAESNYNPSYNAYYNSDEANDNDEFMWTANIVGTIDMSHLTGSSHGSETVTVPATCTEDSYEVTRCPDCGKISSDGSEMTRTAILNVKVNVGEGEAVKTIASGTLSESGAAGKSVTFSTDDIQAAVGDLPEGYTLSGEYADTTVAYGEHKEVVLTATAGEGAAEIAVLNIEVKASDDEDAEVLGQDTLVKVKEKETETTTEAPAETTTEAPAETTTEAPAETTTEVSAETTTEAPAETTTEAPAETTTEASAETTTEAPAETTAKVPEETKTEQPVELEDPAEPEVNVEEKADTLKAEGDPVFTADEIIDAVKAIEVAGYTVPEYTGADVTVAYGASESVSVVAEEVVKSAHRYVKFDETYYTKDSSDNWQTGTSYVCIDCGHAFEVEEDSSVEANLSDKDSVYTADEMESFASKRTKVWTWSTDRTEASMYQVPTELMDHLYDCVWENPALSTREVATVEGDCETGEFTATLKSGETATETVKAGKHSYLNQEEKDDDGKVTQEAAVQWTWADDYSEATAHFMCDVCGKKRDVTVSGDDIAVSKKDATCAENASVTYTATVVVDDINYISSRTVEEADSKTEHSYAEDQPTWNWTQDADGRYTAATADFTCTVCGEKETLDAVITKEIDRKAGNTTYTATVTLGENKYTDTKTVDKIFEEDENPFEDVEKDKYYYDAVLWACGKGITTGTDKTHFSPYNTCTRAQVVTFLWRAAGKPDAKITEVPFRDIETNKYYYNALLWAYENNIVKGISETEFGPNVTVSRGQFVTFLHRQQGTPEPKGENTFVDVEESQYYYDAVLWASENGITTGVDDEGHFAPADGCNRAQVVTFLYRAFAEKE